MKTPLFLFLVMFAALLWSCSPSGESVAPATQNSLAQVVPSTVSGSNTNLLLLSDGRSAIPVSGMPGFNQLRVGNKLSLSFNTGTVQNGVLNIDVKKFSQLKDTTHIPGPPQHDSTTLAGKFSGVVYRARLDSSSMDSTSLYYRSTATVFFQGPNYTCAASPGGYPAEGSGTFTVSNGAITFKDKNTNGDSVLTGTFYFSMYQGNLYMWKMDQGFYTSYSLTKGKG